MHLPPVALQLWSLRDSANADFAQTAAAAAEIGYGGVELAGFGNLDARGARAALDAAGLRIAGIHLHPARLTRELDAVVDEVLALGAPHATCAFWPADQYVSARECQKIGAALGEIGATFRAAGIRFSFHNHAPELRMLEGQTVLDWILGTARSEELEMEPDVYWLHFAGFPPDQFLIKYGPRCRLIHLRDGAEIGSGPVDYAAVFGAIDAVKAAEWLIIEQDRYHYEPLESIRRSFNQLKSWGRCPPA